MSLALLWLQLAVAAAIILGSATFMARSADVVAIKTGLGRSFIGVVLLATATSLPELGIGVSSIALVGEPDLALGDAFGSNIFNLLIIGLLDLYWRNGPILTRVSTNTVVIAMLSVVIISLAASAMFIHQFTDAISGWYISPVSVVMFLVFLVAMYMIYKFERGNDTADGEDELYTEDSLTRAFAIYGLTALIVVVTAVWLATLGDSLKEAMGWEASFVGTQFLALSTSLPELAASIAAIRLNAPELAISNVLGSNLFNMGFILTIDELVFTSGTVWANISAIHSFTAIAAILMTGVVIIATLSRPRSRPTTVLTFESGLLISLYLIAAVLVFYIG